ncbi:MAG: sulfur carrier protein ThiS [Planctomycetota bacterium]
MQKSLEITVNGDPRTFDEPLTLRELIERLDLANAAVAAEVNKALVPRRDHDSTSLADGDTVELVTLVGGG